MPSLHGIHCSIELGIHGHALPEYDLMYGDSHVDCYVQAPDHDVSFCIHLTCSDTSLPGVAAFVFIDGQYQANRNISGTVSGDRGKSRRVDFRLRQKEEPCAGADYMIGRDWIFSNVETSAKPEQCTVARPDTLAQLGTIEIVVLRCRNPNALLCESATDTGKGVYAAHGIGTIRGTAKSWTKPYWPTWSDQLLDSAQKGSRAEAMSAYAKPIVLEEAARAYKIDVQAASGAGHRYYHLTSSPLYLDSMNSPYAAFRYHYRGERYFTTDQQSVVESPDSAKEGTPRTTEAGREAQNYSSWAGKKRVKEATKEVEPRRDSASGPRDKQGEEPEQAWGDAAGAAAWDKPDATPRTLADVSW